MGNELACAGIPTGKVVVCQIRLNSTEQVLNVNTMDTETFTTVNQTVGAYDIICTEQGTSGYYVGSVPTWLTVSDRLNLVYYVRTGSTAPFTYTYETGTTLSWTGGATSFSASGINWITLADYKTFAGITDTSQDTKINLFITLASAMCNVYIDRSIKTTSWATVYRGTDLGFLNLEQWPIQSITTVTFDYADSDQNDVAGSEFIANDVGTIRFNPSSMYARAFDCQWVKVQFVAGYDIVPGHLQAACMFCVQAMMFISDPDVLITSKKDKNISIEYGQPIFDLQNDPMFAPVRSMLAKESNLICI